MKLSLIKIAVLVTLTIAALPLYAQTNWTIELIVDKIISEIINPLITILMVLATVMFLWGVMQMITSSDNEEKRSQGKKHIMWGIVGLFIMVSVWGIIQILCNFFDTCDLIF